MHWGTQQPVDNRQYTNSKGSGKFRQIKRMDVNVDIRPLVERVKDVLRTCYDPEIPVNILELGLIYEIKLDDGNDVHVKMTLTSPACPVAESLPVEVEQKIKGIPDVNNA